MSQKYRLRCDFINFLPQNSQKYSDTSSKVLNDESWTYKSVQKAPQIFVAVNMGRGKELMDFQQTCSANASNLSLRATANCLNLLKPTLANFVNDGRPRVVQQVRNDPAG